MTKKDFTKLFAEKINASQKDAAAIADTFLECVSHALIKNKGLSFVGWGSWKVITRVAREGRNPQTGKPLKIPAKKVIKFKAGAPLEAKVNK